MTRGVRQLGLHRPEIASPSTRGVRGEEGFSKIRLKSLVVGRQ